MPFPCVPLQVAYAPSGTSVKNMAHWAQLVRQSAEHGKPLFRRYDYGTACASPAGRPQSCNRRMYGADEPPAYDISGIRGVPIALFSGVQDILADAVDVQTLLEALPPGAVVATKRQVSFEHLDFTWGLSAARLVYPEVLEVLKESMSLMHPPPGSTGGSSVTGAGWGAGDSGGRLVLQPLTVAA